MVFKMLKLAFHNLLAFPTKDYMKACSSLLWDENEEDENQLGWIPNGECVM